VQLVSGAGRWSRPRMASFCLIQPTFPNDFAADLPAAQADFMAHAQMLTAAKVFTTAVTNPAWKLKPSWYLVPTISRMAP
jgi:hypothetical protein